MKKFISIVMAMCMVFTLGTTALAADVNTTQLSGNAAVQAIMDKVNAEYGTDFHFPTAAELSKANLSNDNIISDPTPEQLKLFEEQLRESAKSSSEINAKSKAAWEAALKESGGVYYTKGSEGLDYVAEPMIRLPKFGSKKIVGATAKIEAWANDNSGYWAWEYVSVIECIRDYNTDLYFNMEDYNYTFIDSKRTCTVNYIGTKWEKNILGWFMPSALTQYVEWWAGM